MTAGRSGTDLAIPPEVATFLQGGPLLILASRGPDLEPESVLATGAVVAEGDALDRLTVFLPQALSGPTLVNLRDNGQAALTASRVTDDRSMQLKGVFLSDRPADARDRALLEPLLAMRVDQMAQVGMPRSVTARLVDWPAVAIGLRIREIFEQTPGPHAGERLGQVHR